MDILNSDWLINMLKKSSKSPHGRLLSLFDILNDLLSAPNVAENLRKNASPQYQPISNDLEHYLTQQAALAGAQEPAMLAHQLYFMVLSAIQESLRLSKSANLAFTDFSVSFSHAKNVATALITAQTKQEFYIKKSSAYAMAASIIGICVLMGGLWFTSELNLDTQAIIAANTKTAKPNLINLTVSKPEIASQLIASPEETAVLLATLEQMRKGNCQFPEALQMPDSYKAIYIENIIGGNVSSKVADQKIIMQILQKVRCNYTPMLMENSRS
ncbi:MAG: hypothetical protein H7Z18_07555 [Methylophilaceae bacterium]|nr:hypothetical protein [Methylophilaceae bacterium]